MVIQDSGMNVILKSGKAFINGYYYENDADKSFALSPSDGVLKRIDSIVICLDHLERQITAKVKQGALSANPIAPSILHTGSIYELKVADISIGAAASEISNAEITDTRLNNDLCGIVHGIVEQVDTSAVFVQYIDWLSKQQTDGFMPVATYDSENTGVVNDSRKLGGADAKDFARKEDLMTVVGYNASTYTVKKIEVVTSAPSSAVQTANPNTLYLVVT
ncbi:MAG: hypothetical protein RR716_06970 [Christensenellaceae bacterium]